MALIVKKENGFIDESVDIKVDSLYVWITPTFAGKHCLVQTIVFLNKEKKKQQKPTKIFQLPKKNKNDIRGNVYECVRQDILEAHELEKQFLESQGYEVTIVDL